MCLNGLCQQFAKLCESEEGRLFISDLTILVNVTKYNFVTSKTPCFELVTTALESWIFTVSQRLWHQPPSFSGIWETGRHQ